MQSVLLAATLKLGNSALHLKLAFYFHPHGLTQRQVAISHARGLNQKPKRNAGDSVFQVQADRLRMCPCRAISVQTKHLSCQCYLIYVAARDLIL